jgi:hypothetical protein
MFLVSKLNQLKELFYCTLKEIWWNANFDRELIKNYYFLFVSEFYFEKPLEDKSRHRPGKKQRMKKSRTFGQEIKKQWKYVLQTIKRL